MRVRFIQVHCLFDIETILRLMESMRGYMDENPIPETLKNMPRITDLSGEVLRVGAMHLLGRLR